MLPLPILSVHHVRTVVIFWDNLLIMFSQILLRHSDNVYRV